MNQSVDDVRHENHSQLSCTRKRPLCRTPSLAAGKLVLVVPAYKGGGLLKEALLGVDRIPHVFQCAIISINGPSPSNIADRDIAEQTLNQVEHTILTTGQELTPVQHFIWLSQQLRRRYGVDQMVMFLCHDDLLEVETIAAQSMNRKWNHEPDEVWLGDYKIFGDYQVAEQLLTADGLATSFPESIRDCESVSKSTWLESQEGVPNCFTNLSGLVVSLRSVSALASYLRLTRGSKGCRTEYMLATHRSIKRVRRFRKPVVAIRQHSTQEGRLIKSEEYLADELRYCVWRLLNADSPRLLVRLAASDCGLANIVYLLLTMTNNRWSDRNPFGPPLNVLLKLTTRLRSLLGRIARPDKVNT